MNNHILRIVFILIITPLNPLLALWNESRVELRSGPFFHSSALFRDIYGNVNWCYGVEGTTDLSNNLDAWVNVDWTAKHGYSEGFGELTRVSIANISGGIKHPFRFFNYVTPYLGIGASFSGIWINNTSCDLSTASKLCFGGVLKTGVYFTIFDQFFLDLFFDYLYQPVHFENNVDIGGFKTGLGIGYKF